jgi:hypothetical protein
LAIPHKEVGPVRREIERVSKDWPRQKAELKGGQLQPEHLETLVNILFRHDALLHVCAVDVSKEDPAGVDRHKATQCDGFTKHLTSEHHPDLVAEVWQLRRTLERMPRQLYFQYVLLSQLVWSASVESALYFSQRRPRELATFEWTIDAKDPRRVTTYENWWRDILAPALESRSRRDPMICVDDPSFNYRFFDRSFGMKKEAWYPDSPPKLVDGYDIRKMITDHIAFVDSRSEILIQAVDIVASFLRRLLAREIDDDAVARALGRLQIRQKRHRQLQCIRLLTLAPFPGKRNELFKMVQTMSAASRSMLKPERRRSQRPDQRGVVSRFANRAQKKPRPGSRGRHSRGEGPGE